ncbi:hypothetical protein lerEdw1_017692 [Lerista edwardsae]|nr:hypothetical protein lerEdw1_017692 [Lerista edwardsae]
MKKPTMQGSHIVLLVLMMGCWKEHLGVESKPYRCELPADIGTCSEAKIIMYYYDGYKGECQPFPFTGCGGNNNRFEWIKDCVWTCKYGKFIPLWRFG